MSGILGTAPPTIKELMDIRQFFPEGCFFALRPGETKIPEGSLIVFRESDGLIQKACRGCRLSECKVRRAPYRGL